jgi:hypothetical protein
MMTDEELVAWLREKATVERAFGEYEEEASFVGSADAIERLTRELNEARALLRDIDDAGLLVAHYGMTRDQYNRTRDISARVLAALAARPANERGE